MNLQKMMQQAQNLQGKIAQMQAKLEAEETEGTSGGGMVKVVLTGKRQCRKVSVDPSLVNPAEKDMLEDLLIAAFNDATSKVESHFTEEMAKVAGQMGLPPGLKLPF